MPVRIYDIARKLGLESKFVIAKAKEFGISHAKVASSTLDKITAEYLEEKLTPLANPAASPASVLPGVTEPAPLPEAEVSSVVPVEVDVTPAAVAAIVPPPIDISPPDGARPHAEPAAVPAPNTETEAPPPIVTPAPSAVPVIVPPVSFPVPIEPPTELPVTPQNIEPPPPPPVAPLSPTVTVPSPPSPAPLPTVPRTPGLGELVGRIELPVRGRPGTRPAPPAPPPSPVRRPEVARGRPGQPSASQRGPAPGVAPRPVSPPPAPAKPAGGPGKAPSIPDFVLPTVGPMITLKPPIIVRDLAEKLNVKAYRILHDLMELNVFANLNQSIDEKIAQFLAARHGFRFEVERREKGAGQVHAPIRKVELDQDDLVGDLKSRPPVVTIMGHVDHGKTTLLDVIRKSDVAAREAGGITQHIGAYTIQVPHPERPNELQQLTFLDTPGHAAFSAMRARGANVTDIVILVVAASEGVMPQTVEALNHAKAAKVPIMVAVNKSDLPTANPLRTRQQLQEYGLVAEEWGGETIFVDVSATTRMGVDQLLAMLVLQSEVMELKANPNRRAKGNVVESGLEPGGPTATVLVRKGTLRQGDFIICGSYYGRTRALISEEGTRLKEAGPSVAVKVLGLNGVPEAGLEFSVVESEKAARALAEEREMETKAAGRERGPRVTLENLLTVIEQQSAKVLKVVVKGDTQGSVEAIVEALKKLDTPKVSLEIVHSAVGTISKDDVMLAASAKGIIVGFHTRMDNGVPAIAKREAVQIKQYEIIYELIDEVRNAMAGLLDPELKEVTIGGAEVRQIFDLSKGGRVAGCMVQHGRMVKGKARILRRKEVIHDGIIQTLRRYQDEVSEVRSGLECGIRVSSFEDIQVGDIIESYTVEKVPQQL